MYIFIDEKNKKILGTSTNKSIRFITENTVKIIEIQENVSLEQLELIEKNGEFNVKANPKQEIVKETVDKEKVEMAETIIKLSQKIEELGGNK